MRTLFLLTLTGLLVLSREGEAQTHESAITKARTELAALPQSSSGTNYSPQSLELYDKLTNLYIAYADSYDGRDRTLDSARYFVNQYLETAQALQIELAEADALTLKGKVAHLRMQYRESYVANYQAYHIYSQYPVERCRYLFECLKRMGRIQYNTLEDYEKAMGYFMVGEKIAKTREDRSFMLRQIGLCYLKLKNDVLARQFLYKSLALAQKSTYERAMTLNFLGESYIKSGDTTRGEAMIQRAIRLDSSTVTRSAGHLLLAKLNLDRKETEQTLVNAQLALQYATLENNNLSDRAEAWQYLYEAYKQRGDYAKALTYYERYKATADSLPKSKGMQDYYQIMVELEREKLAEKEEEANFQRKYKLWITVIAILLLLIGAGLIWLNQSVRRKQRKIEAQNKEIEQLNETLEIRVQERTAELEKANRELVQKNREISEALLMGQTMERKRVAAELHDNLGGLLAVARMTIQALNPEHLSSQEKVIYDDVLAMMKHAYEEIRFISHNMLPVELEKHGLEAGLKRLVLIMNNSRSQTQFTLQVSGLEERLSQDIEFNAYNICLELCNNILKHAKALLAEIVVEKKEDTLRVTVSDDGVGFEVDQLPEGMGLRNIRERAEAIGGTLEIHSAPQKGTHVVLAVTV